MAAWNFVMSGPAQNSTIISIFPLFHRFFASNATTPNWFLVNNPAKPLMGLPALILIKQIQHA
jgi:hypothetical protein